MKISHVEAIRVRVAVPRERQHVTDSGVVAAVETVLVRITTESGLVGYGESKVDGGATKALVTQVNDVFAPLLVGQNAHDITRLWETMYNGSRVGHTLQRGHGFPIAIMRRGIPVAAIAGIDMALWDLKGKALGVPVWQLLGGKVRDRVRTYGSGGWAPADRIGDQLREYIEYGGFRTVKMRVGAGDDLLSTSVRRVQAARKALGPEIDITVDAHGTFAVAEAKRFSRLVAECDLAWFEDPVSPNDLSGCAEVRATTDIPIAIGERASTRYDAMDMLQHRALDVLQPDLSICGGITEAVRIAGLAAGFNVRVAPHVWGGCVLYAASLAFAAATPTAFILEHCMATNPLLRELPQDPFESREGYVDVRDVPGLGVTIDEEFLKRHRTD